MWFGRQGSGVELDRWLLLDALRALRRGDFATHLPPGFAAADGEIAATFNEIVEIARTLQDELRELRTSVGRDGRRQRRLRDAGMRGGWAACVWSVNELLDDVLASPPAEPVSANANARAGRVQPARGEPLAGERFDAVVELLAGALGAAQAREREDTRSGWGGGLAYGARRNEQRPDERSAAYRALEHKTSKLEQRNSELERRLRELSASHDQLAEGARRHEQAAAHRSQFLAAMSHELRTPLNTLLTLSLKLKTETQTGRLEPQLAKYVDAIGQAGSDLLSLANDVLDVARLEAGALHIEPGAVAIADLAAYAAQSFDPVALERRLSFHVSVDPELPAAIETDAKRLKQVLRNLLENAFKFTERGGVRLSILCNERRDGIAFAVSDTGIGIWQKDQELIFEPFKQAAVPVSRDEPGTGLGLTISREIAHALGGSLQVSSVPARGSTFTLELPLVETRVRPNSEIVERVERSEPQRPGLRALDNSAPEPSAGRRNERAAAEPALAGRRVRVVNGDVRHVFAVTAALEPHKVRVSYGEGSDGEIRGVAAAEGVDAVLVDIEGPALGGRETLLRMRARNPRPAVLIAMVSRAERGAREHCIAAGADDCVAKPLDPDELIGTLEAWLTTRASGAQSR